MKKGSRIVVICAILVVIALMIFASVVYFTNKDKEKNPSSNPEINNPVDEPNDPIDDPIDDPISDYEQEEANRIFESYIQTLDIAINEYYDLNGYEAMGLEDLNVSFDEEYRLSDIDLTIINNQISRLRLNIDDFTCSYNELSLPMCVK